MIRVDSGVGFLRPLSVMVRVVIAVVLRETKTRFGRNKLGYLWALVEPSAYIVIFLFMRLQQKSVIPFGESAALFFLTGLLAFRMFTSVASRGVTAINANRALLAYPPVKPNDIIFARILLELMTMYVIILLFYGLLAVATSTHIIIFPGRFAAGLATLTLLSVGAAVFNAVVATLYPFWERVWGLLRLPLLLLSGIFYVPKSLPGFAQEVIWWNPLTHCIEWIRTGTYLTYSPMLDQAYAISWGAVLLTMALWLERSNRARIVEP
jgi:capsular polysaccharide transport system permease protein